MNRTGKGKKTPNVKPVQKIELSEKKIGLRLVLVVLLLVIAAGAFAYAINAFVSTGSGWQEIEADSAADTNCSDEFILMYHLGADGASATVENKAIRQIYTDAMVKVYQLFHTKEEFEGVANICYINQHPNEVIEVDDVLYHAFSVVQSYKNRVPYLAPVYTSYDDIFYCNDDSELVNYDPNLNEEVALAYQEIASFAQDAGAVDVQLLGDNKIMLYVSDAYLAYAEENYITDFVDFFWMKNAFIVDYLADVLTEKGYTRGTISSYDGFIRNLDESGEVLAYNIFDREEEGIYLAATMNYSGPQSIVYMRNYPMNSLDNRHYYELDNGQIRTSYLDVSDAVCKSTRNDLVAHTKAYGCAETLMQLAPVYIADSFDKTAVSALADKEIYTIYSEDYVIYYNDESIRLEDLYVKEDIAYTACYAVE